MADRNESYNVTLRGRIQFDPSALIEKHEIEKEWKKTAFVLFSGDECEYYAWLLNRRFNLELIKPQRGPHLTFISDAFRDLNRRTGTDEEKQALWNKVKEKWEGKEIDVVMNTRPFFDDKKYWWLIVDHKHRDEIHGIRKELGLGFPYFGLHMTIGAVNEKNLYHSEYIKTLVKKNYVLLNQDYTNESPIHIKRLTPERVDLYNPSDMMMATLFNEHELMHVRTQVAEKNLEGYYIVWKDKKVKILPDGEMEYWPEGLYDIGEKLFVELLKAKKKNEEKI